jgi:3-deoxy-7-phosphoheptulonate synthase
LNLSNVTDCTKYFGVSIKFHIVGPCALENLEQIKPIVDLCVKRNIPYFRSQLFKPRTNPDSFQGLGESGYHLIEYIKDHGLKVVIEAMSLAQLRYVESFADIIQIGARNMQNFELLKSVGSSEIFQKRLPFVMLKRGFSNTEEEWISSAKYLEKSGVPKNKIILCERGTRNFCSPHGVTLDLALAKKVQMQGEYNVIVDPSHGTKSSELVLPLSKAILAMEFDGIMVEIHPNPEQSKSDKEQALTPTLYDSFLQQLNK